MSGKECKRNAYRRNFNEENCFGGEKGCFKPKRCVKEDGCGFEKGYGWDNCARPACNWQEYGWDCGKKCNDEFKAQKNHNNKYNEAVRENCCDENRAVNKHCQHDDQKHKLNKEFENKHRKCNKQAYQDADNVCNLDSSRNSKKYLVDKLYIYEHHRVIDLNCCQNDRKHNEAHRDFKDLECAIEDFEEAGCNVAEFNDHDRRDFEAYENARAKTRDLQNCKADDSFCYSWKQ